MKNKNGFTHILVLLIIAVGLVGVGYFLGNNIRKIDNGALQLPPNAITINELPTLQPIPSGLVVPTKKPNVQAYDYTGWQTYSDSKAGSSIMYAPGYRLNTKTEGENVNILNCTSGTCLSGISLGVYSDYKGGSRREWLNNKVDLSTYEVVYEEFVVAGVKALIVDANDSQSIGMTFVVIPRGNKVYLFSKETGQENFDEVKKIVSSFKFI